MTFQFKIQLKNIENPSVWRRVLVAEDITFDAFHRVIQAAFGWENSHFYQFLPKSLGSRPAIGLPYDDPYGDEEEDDQWDSQLVKISELFTKPKQKFNYIYDMGDDWRHAIVLEKILDERIIGPLCTAGEGACPPEDCGGPWGYANLVEALNNPEHPEHKEMRSWVGLRKGKLWDLNAFDIKAANKRIGLAEM